MSKEADDLQLLFPTVVQISQVDGHEALNRTLLEVIESIRRSEPNSKPSSWSCELFTTIGSPSTLLEYPGVQAFRQISLASAQKFADAVMLDTGNHPLKLNECWMNIYRKTHA